MSTRKELEIAIASLLGEAPNKLSGEDINLFRGTSRFHSKQLPNWKGIGGKLSEEEKILELVRQREFPNRPSRLSSTFWTTSPSAAVDYATQWGTTTTGHVASVRKKLKDVFVADAYHYDQLRDKASLYNWSTERKLEEARKYWQGADLSAGGLARKYSTFEALIPEAVRPERTLRISGIQQGPSSLDPYSDADHGFVRLIRRKKRKRGLRSFEIGGPWQPRPALASDFPKPGPLKFRTRSPSSRLGMALAREDRRLRGLPFEQRAREAFIKGTSSTAAVPRSDVVRNILEIGGARKSELAARRISPTRLMKIASNFFEAQGIKVYSGEKELAAAIAAADTTLSSREVEKKVFSAVGTAGGAIFSNTPVVGGKGVFIRPQKELQELYLFKSLSSGYNPRTSRRAGKVARAQISTHEAAEAFLSRTLKSGDKPINTHAHPAIYAVDTEFAAMMGPDAVEYRLRKHAAELDKTLLGIGDWKDSAKRSQTLEQLFELPKTYRRILRGYGYSEEQTKRLIQPVSDIISYRRAKWTPNPEIAKRGMIEPSESALERMNELGWWHSKGGGSGTSTFSRWTREGRIPRGSVRWIANEDPFKAVGKAKWTGLYINFKGHEEIIDLAKKNSSRLIEDLQLKMAVGVGDTDVAEAIQADRRLRAAAGRKASQNAHQQIGNRKAVDPPAVRKAKQSARHGASAAAAKTAQKVAELELPASLSDYVSGGVRRAQAAAELPLLSKVVPYAAGMLIGADVLASREKAGPFWGGVVAGAAWLVTRGKAPRNTRLLAAAVGYGAGRLVGGAIEASHRGQLEGFPERGFAPAMRQEHTSFGSGYRGGFKLLERLSRSGIGKYIPSSTREAFEMATESAAKGKGWGTFVGEQIARVRGTASREDLTRWALDEKIRHSDGPLGIPWHAKRGAAEVGMLGAAMIGIGIVIAPYAGGIAGSYARAHATGHSHSAQHNPEIGGFRERGEAAIGRKQLTEFGSGYQGLGKTFLGLAKTLAGTVLDLAPKELRLAKVGEIPGAAYKGVIPRSKPFTGAWIDDSPLLQKLVQIQEPYKKVGELQELWKLGQERRGVYEKLLPVVKQDPYTYKGVSKKINPTMSFGREDINQALADYARETGKKVVPLKSEPLPSPAVDSVYVATGKLENIGDLGTLAAPVRVAAQSPPEVVSPYARTGLNDFLSSGGSRPRSVNEMIQASGSPTPAFSGPPRPISGTADTILPSRNGTLIGYSVSLRESTIQASEAKMRRGLRDFEASNPIGARMRAHTPSSNLESFTHEGMAGALRKRNTGGDFGTGWDPARKIAAALFGKAAREGAEQAGRGGFFKRILRRMSGHPKAERESFAKLVQSDEFREALSAGRPIKQIGAGGMGSVELMETEIAGEKFQYVRKTYFQENLEVAARYADEEAAGLARLQESISPTPYARGRVATGKGDEFREALFMEYIGADEKPGSVMPLSAILARRSKESYAQDLLSWRKTLRKGIKKLRSLGAYHGDIKPDNIMISEKHGVVLIDPMSNRFGWMGEGHQKLGQIRDKMALEALVLPAEGSAGKLNKQLSDLANSINITSSSKIEDYAGSIGPSVEWNRRMIKRIGRFGRSGLPKAVFELPTSMKPEWEALDAIAGERERAAMFQIAPAAPWQLVGSSPPSARAAGQGRVSARARESLHTSAMQSMATNNERPARRHTNGGGV